MNEAIFFKQIPQVVFEEQRYHALASIIQEAIEKVTGVSVYVNLFEDEMEGQPAVSLRVEEVSLISFEYTNY